jgi:dihydroxy-acid dehydratase
MSGTTDGGPADVATALRSGAWFADDGKNGFIARSHLAAVGIEGERLRRGPVIGICTSWSDLTPCNSHLRQVAVAVRSGIEQAGGVGLEFPTMSIGEPYARPTSMLYRNLMAMDVEESIRSNPLDAVVLLGGCDKTVPAQLMGAASVDLPTIVLTGGPMLSGRYRGQPVGSGTEVWRAVEAHRSGLIDRAALDELEGCLNRSIGHCMTMGTASTMACLTEALGMQLAGSAALPAADGRRTQLANLVGRRIVEMARTGGPRPSEILTRDAFLNAIRVNAAIGGSTNAVLHLLAIAGRVGVELDLTDFDEAARQVPLLVDLEPSGRFLMEDFAYAGGVPVLVSALRDLLDPTPLTVEGTPFARRCEVEPVPGTEAIRTLADPVLPAGTGTAVLRGNLAPDGALLKVSAASEHLLQHVGPALVFDRFEDYLAVADDEDLPVTEDTVLVVRNAGPKGYPGMPEIANLPIPSRLLRRGVTDLVRVCDGRMSGTAFGTVVLHVAPESAVGGPLGLVRTGDSIRLDVAARTIDMLVDEEELDRRRSEDRVHVPVADRGWVHLFQQHVLQADRGVDLDILVGGSGGDVPRRPF